RRCRIGAGGHQGDRRGQVRYHRRECAQGAFECCGRAIARLKPRATNSMTHTVVTFGELLLRLSPPGFERFFQSPVLSATFGGGEANVAASLAQFGLNSRYVTALPKHAIGEAGLRALRAEGIATSGVVRSGDRVGIYFAETGASQRASTVIYDRARSAISEMEPGAVAWDAVMNGASWFHVTGITPALGDKAVESTKAAVAAARRAG